MKSGFNDPIKIKEQKPQDKPKGRGKESPWNFECPQYDERSSNFVNAGTHYGVGHKQPVGHEGNPKMRAPTLPMDGVKTMQDDDRG
jgi:hypothetical protein